MSTTLTYLGRAARSRLAKSLPKPVRFAWLGLAIAMSPAPLKAAFHPIDLPEPPAGLTNGVFSGLPTGTLNAGQIPFRMQPALRLTGIEDARRGQLFPAAIPGIAIGRTAAVLHLLHGVDGAEKDGTPLASLVLHYAGGQQQVVRLAYGVHARNHAPVRNESRRLHDPNSAIAWHGTNRLQGRQLATLRLYRTAIPNPLPSEKLMSVDLVSLFSRATPVLLAMTVEDDPVVTAIEEPRESRVLRNSREFDDAVYHDRLTIRAAGPDGKPIPAAEASLTISDMEGSYFFGQARADSTGRIRLPYPPQHAAGITAIVRANDRMPFVYSTPKGMAGRVPGEIAATLVPGSTTGGIVRSSTGEAIPGANVTIYHLHQSGAREYTRLDHDTVTTDASGRWRTSSTPPSLDGFQFAIAHPDFRPRVYTVATNQAPAPFSLRDGELRSASAVATLEPGLRVAGTIRGEDGKPVAGAEVRVAGMRSSEPNGDEIVTGTDRDGRFKFTVMSAGTYSVIVVADGHSPEVQAVSLREQQGPQALDFELKAGRRLVGRVTDQHQQPISGVKVRLEGWNNTRLLKFEAETDDTGAFTWTNAPEGQLRFYLSATNHSSTTYSISGNASEHRFTLRKFSSVRGSVVDAETRKPISNFSIYRGRAYNPGEPIRWERYNTFRGRNGEYNVRLVEYSSSGRTAILIEAPGYMPVASQPFTKAGLYTNDFELKKARGLGGRVLASDGTPVAGALLALLEPAENAYFQLRGELTRSSDGGMQVRSDRSGEFMFPPRLDPHTIIATHDSGFAEVRITNALAPLTVTLQPWARITGTVKLPAPDGRPHSVRLQNAFYRYADASRESQPLSLYLSVTAEADGAFRFDRVPPGERRIAVYHSIKVGDSTRSANSHGVALLLQPGQSTNIVIGEGGRTVVGRMEVQGGDSGDVDWKRDFHSLNPVRVLNMNLPQLDFSNARTEAQQQALWAKQRLAEAAFWRTPAGRDYERSERSYILQFETNGTFRVDGVPPGRYHLQVSPTDPTREDYSYEQIGNFSKEVIVPEAKSGRPNEPFDLGSLQIAVRTTMRIGKKAPRFTVTGFDGKEAKLEDFRGRYLLVDFWATWSGSRSLDLRYLKLVQERYAKDSRLAMVGISLDHARQLAEQELKNNPLSWPQFYGGSWNESPLRMTYSLRSLPDCLLIDPDGKIASLNVRGSGILRAVERALGEPKTGTP